MKRILKLISLAIAAVMLFSLIACNQVREPAGNEGNKELANQTANNVTSSSTDGTEAVEKMTEAVLTAKDKIVINANGIVEESERAANELGIYMPDPIMNGAAGTYPVQGFLLSGSTPADTYGNGMAIVYRLSDGSLLIFDSGSGTVKYMLYKCLKDLSGGGKIRVAAWVLTHSHGDHYGAMYDLLSGIHKEEFEIQEFWFNRATNTADGTNAGVHLEKLFNQLAVGDTKVRVLEYGKTYTLDGGRVSAKVLCTPANVAGKSGLDENTNSLVMMLTIGGKKLLMTGDANKPAWDFMVSQHNSNPEYSLKCDYLQMPHHAVHDAGTTAGYNAANPSYVIIPSTTGLAKQLTTSSNAKPSYELYKKHGIDIGSLKQETDNTSYWFAGCYGKSGTQDIKCFFTYKGK